MRPFNLPKLRPLLRSMGGVESSALMTQASKPRRIALLPERASDITCFGVGDGVLIRQLLERPGTNKVRVVLLDPHLSFLLLSHFEHPWLDSPNLEITVASSIRRLPTDFVEVLGELHAAGVQPITSASKFTCISLHFSRGLGVNFTRRAFARDMMVPHVFSRLDPSSKPTGTLPSFLIGARQNDGRCWCWTFGNTSI